jgi:hypothetical protein
MSLYDAEFQIPSPRVVVASMNEKVILTSYVVIHDSYPLLIGNNWR